MNKYDFELMINDLVEQAMDLGNLSSRKTISSRDEMILQEELNIVKAEVRRTREELLKNIATLLKV